MQQRELTQYLMFELESLHFQPCPASVCLTATLGKYSIWSRCYGSEDPAVDYFVILLCVTVQVWQTIVADAKSAQIDFRVEFVFPISEQKKL